MSKFDVVSVHYVFIWKHLCYALSVVSPDVSVGEQVDSMLSQGLVDSSTKLGKYSFALMTVGNNGHGLELCCHGFGSYRVRGIFNAAFNCTLRKTVKL